MSFRCDPHSEFRIDCFSFSYSLQQFIHEVQSFMQIKNTNFVLVIGFRKCLMFYFYDEHEARECTLTQVTILHSAHPPFAMKFDTNLRACTSCPCPMEIARHSSKIGQHIMMECNLRINYRYEYVIWQLFYLSRAFLPVHQSGLLGQTHTQEADERCTWVAFSPSCFKIQKHRFCVTISHGISNELSGLSNCSVRTPGPKRRYGISYLDRRIFTVPWTAWFIPFLAVTWSEVVFWTYPVMSYIHQGFVPLQVRLCQTIVSKLSRYVVPNGRMSKYVVSLVHQLEMFSL